MEKRQRNLAVSRHFWVLAHRWVGLSIAGFLIVVGLTGSLLAFLPELNHALTPHLFPAARSAPALGLGELALAAQALMPQAEVKTVYIDTSGSALIGVKPKTDPKTGKPYELGANQLILDSATGRERGRRTVGKEELPTGLENLMPFIYHLHFGLSLGKTGNVVLGIVALLWTVDCFVAFYLTLPAGRKNRSGRSGRPMATPNGTAGNALLTQEQSRSFWHRWKPAWLVKWTASRYRINFDLHRAGGLWLWTLLLIFAWSSVSFNLHKEVYEPFMRIFFDLPPLEKPAKRSLQPGAVALGWREAQSVAERLMREQAEIHGFSVEEPIALYRQAELGRYHYRVRSSLDVQQKNSITALYFDLYSGQLQHLHLPTTQHSGYTVSAWLKALHEGDVFGLPYRIFVSVAGLAIVMLSVTGVIIWLRKSRARKIHLERGVRSA
ncbi:PepSY domain-containing protein [Candidatus Methylospira mobilis]|uniref:PepSY domain-containing protein n=1 Tax=Candidatus Methylospira mobilis TaxID=1808979 RepID=A0A5Q0BKW0_9GAMM|nr:PepSY-associated TM helix domain-containing protein [Candidatus Methylospira mobilis]QFY44565.1 PepSY domain-containing protein [Candidatus Methylospira mobilis]